MQKRFFLKTLSMVLGLATAGTCIAVSALEPDISRKDLSPQLSQTVAEAPKGFVPMLTKERGSSSFRGPKPKQATYVNSYSSTNNIPVLYGNVIYSDDDSFTIKSMYKIPTGEGQEFENLGGSSISANYGGVEINGTYYAHTIISNVFYYIRKYNTETWKSIVSKSTKVGRMATDLAYDPIGEKVYGCFYNDNQSAYVFGSIDYTTYERTAISNLDEGWNACACDASGTLYAISLSGVLYTVNKDNGTLTKVGDTGVTPRYLTSATIDPKSGRMFWTVCPADDTAHLYEVNTSTGKATHIYQFPNGEQVVGLYVAPPEAEEKAPAAISDLTLDFQEGALTGKVNFKAPTSTYDGTPATGDLTYTIEANGQQVAQGITSFGEHVAASVTVDKAAVYKFVVRVANSVGMSPKVQLSSFIGKDTPKAPEVTARYANGCFNVSWTPVSESANGGYLNPEAVKYTVTRAPGEVIATEITATSISDPVAVPESLTDYYYTVVATAEGNSSPAGKSNIITLGNLEPPYSETFENEAALDPFTIIDGNEDGKQWAFNNGKARLNFSSKSVQNDWLILPPIKLEKNKIYYFSMEVTTAKSYDERFEVRFGRTNTAEGMTETLVAPTDVRGENLIFGGDVLAKEDGVYYIGIHGISKKNQFYLDVDNLKLTSGSDALIPSAPSGLTVTADNTGALRAEISFTTPDKTLAETALASLEKVELYRDSVLIKTFSTPAPGSQLSFTDTEATSGIHQYTAVAYNDRGRGREATTSMFIGINTPAPVTSIAARETSNIGEVTINWKAPETDTDGYPINPALVSYDIVSVCGTTEKTIAQNLTSTTYTYKVVEKDTPQEFYYYQVIAKTNGGSASAVSASIPVGKADTAPYYESFAGGKASHAIDGAPEYGNCSWQIYSDINNLNVASVDSDNGFAASTGEYGNDAAALFTGKIDLTGIKSPMLVFQAYNIPSSTGEINDRNIIEVYVNNGLIEKLIESFVMRDLKEPGWMKIYVPLSSYAGKTIQLKWISRIASYKYTLIDDIRIIDRLDYNLTASSIEAPSKVNPDTDFNVTVKIDNLGARTAKDYKVSLYADNVKIGTADGPSVMATAYTSIQFTTRLGVIHTSPVALHAVVEYEADLDPADNISDKVMLTVKQPKYPAPTGLQAQSHDNMSVNLTWNEPDTEISPVALTESFETTESFAINDVDEWTFIDADGSKTYGINNISFPNSGSPMAYIILDKTWPGMNEVISPHSGDKLLATFAATTGENDDWAISPRLSGTSQKIAFYARSFSDEYPETFEFYYSTSGTARTDFVKTDDTHTVPAEWTKYEFDIPAGSRYFAIRCISKDQYIFMLDDFDFVSASPGEGLTILGYNLYRDSLKINDKTVEEPSYLDPSPVAGLHSYVVSAVYDKGESSPSDATTIMLADVKTVGTTPANIHVKRNEIIVSGAAGQAIDIVTADGKTIYHTLSATDKIICAVQPGVYAIRVGSTATKVIVR